MSWGWFIFCLLGICLFLSPSKKAQEWDNETARKSNMLRRNSKPSDLHIAGDAKAKMIEKRLQSQKSTDKIHLPSARKKGENRNKHRHEEARGMNSGLLPWGTFHWLNSKDFTNRDMGFEAESKEFWPSVTVSECAQWDSFILGPHTGKAYMRYPRSIQIMSGFYMFP